MLNNEYIEKLNDRLPKQLKGFEYLFLDVIVKGEYNKDLEKYKVKKAPLVYNWNNLPLENYTLNAIRSIAEKNIIFNNAKRLKNLSENKLNLALLIKSSPYCIIDIDSASINLKRIKLIQEYASPEVTDLLKKFLEALSDTFTVSSGNNGFHHYFYAPDLKSRINSSKTKCLKVNNLLTEEQLKEYNNNVDEKYKLTYNQSLDIDFLSDSSYIIIPPSSFRFYDMKKNKWIQNYYEVYKDNGVKNLDEDLIVKLLDLREEKEAKNKNSKFISSLVTINQLNSSSIFSKLRDINPTEISNELYIEVVAKDEELKAIVDWIKLRYPNQDSIYKKQVINYYHRLRYLIERDYFDQNGYAYLAYRMIDDYNAMNHYAQKKKGFYAYNYFSNVFKCLKSSQYDKADRSNFEYAFVLLELAKSTRPEILWEIIQRELSPKTKIYDRKYYLQLINKIENTEIKIDSRYPMADLFQFYLDAYKIDYRYYFERSANSSAFIFLALIDRAIKIGRIDSNFWEIKYESLTNIGLMAHVDAKTVKESLEKLASEGFIILNENRNFKNRKNNKDLLESKIFSITINHQQKYKLKNINTITPHAFIELQHITGIGKTGSLIYSFLLDKKPRTLQEIYELFPTIKNPYNNIKPKVNFLYDIGLLEYFEEDKTYISSTSKLFSKLVYAKEIEFKNKIKRVQTINYRNVVNQGCVDSLIGIKKSRKSSLKHEVEKKFKDPKPKPLDTNLFRANKARKRRNSYLNS
ncbi:hypothetical protein LPTSP2_38690 [Leptospira ellinghausenii]|uniref:DNA primase/polymerase bifunctional N-terminal domain-containing protein n=1 Tax=Leptospira ellinghausenii TaxID=1917822 RepID=A0A2P2DIT8_9LEPT|nr:bifunctional DNA primase/polymerase [Leptospira ellinghausenii]GBF44566.1 hypothetical protein LPTSP2_38690 [Leptospira ellinghausenii]